MGYAWVTHELRMKNARKTQEKRMKPKEAFPSHGKNLIKS